MTLGHNLLAGLANSVWSALIGLAVIPFYLDYLGIEAYGLIGFYVTTQVLLQLLDMGMAPTINREVARCAAAGDIGEAGKLLHTLAVVYWSMSVVIVAIIVGLAPFIAEYWLQSRQLSAQTLTHAVMLMGLVLACRWPIGLYQGAIVGAQRLAVASAINMTMVTVGSVGAIAVLAFVSPTIEAFFIWQTCVGLFYAVTMRAAAWRIIGAGKAGRFDGAHIQRVLRFSLGVGAISFAGLMLTQMDKVILSKTLGLENFGKYMLATMAANSLYILIVPIFNVSFPRFSALVEQQNQDELLAQYRISSQLLAALLFPAAMILILLAQPLIRVWTGNEQLAVDVAPLMSLLLFAYALHGVMHMPYALMLAHGKTRSMFAIYIVLIVVMVPLTATLSILYGVTGGAFAQLLLFMFYLFVGIWVTHRRYFRGYAAVWLSKDVGVPLGISALAGVIGFAIMPVLQGATLAEILAGILLWLGAILAIIYASRSLRSIIIGYWKNLRYR
ncbi:MAG TPA: oligosaccharide flippase family protein [Rhodocyclaceae bacterium]|nr:oligosaccharide flippase family protein [Rhodocyclaceae bacterium]